LCLARRRERWGVQRIEQMAARGGRGSGHVRASMPAAVNQPCAIESCNGACNDSWVNFSIRRYGVPLCSKHSA
jgi:hypothetical protein